MTDAEKILKARTIIRTGGTKAIIDGAKYIAREFIEVDAEEYAESIKTKREAMEVIWTFINGLLDNESYSMVARLLWGPDLFNIEPRSVKMVWDELFKNAELLVMGAGSMGKSYTIGVWTLLDWLRDPENTCVKIVSATEEHAKGNLFANIKRLHKESLIKLPGKRMAKSIQIDNGARSDERDKDDKQGIHLTPIPRAGKAEGGVQKGAGRLQGFHPNPRTDGEHPKFGKLTRIRVVIDEAEEVAQSVWADIDNVLITKEGVDRVKVLGAANPRDRNSEFGIRCAPKGGWKALNMEDAEKWLSELGWRIIRLDGARCENVEQRKIVHEGLLTWEGFQRYLALGDKSPEYFTMARGWFPEIGMAAVIIPPNYVEDRRGQFLFSGRVTYCSSTDLAFEGGDSVIMTVGRFGMANGIRWMDAQKGIEMFDVPRWGLELERQFKLPKLETYEQVEQMIETYKNLAIPPEWNVVDRTGNGTGVYHGLMTRYGRKVAGIHWGEEATEKKVMDDWPLTAAEMYDGITTEMFFRMRTFLEFKYVLFGPMLKLHEGLQRQLTTREYKQSTKKRVKAESKKEYKAKGNKSPDEADSAIMLVHHISCNSDFAAIMLADAMKPKGQRARHRTGKRTAPKFKSMTVN